MSNNTKLGKLQVLVLDDVLKDNPRALKLLSARTLAEFKQLQIEFLWEDRENYVPKHAVKQPVPTLATV